MALLQHGADLHAKTKQRKNALGLAKGDTTCCSLGKAAIFFSGSSSAVQQCRNYSQITCMYVEL